MVNHSACSHAQSHPGITVAHFYETYREKLKLELVDRASRGCTA